MGTRVGTRVGKDVGANVGNRVGGSVGFGQSSSSVAEQVVAVVSHAVAPQQEKGVGAAHAAHDKVSLRSAGPAQPSQSRDPVPA